MPNITKFTRKHYNQNSEQRDEMEAKFGVIDNIRAEYDMWSWIYQEIANLRNEISRLGLLVRMNTRESPSYLEAYHAHIYSFLIPISTILHDRTWDTLNQRWLKCFNMIKQYFQMRKARPNIKIPFELICELDKLYRDALRIAQRVGLGIKVTLDGDRTESVAAAITGITTKQKPRVG